MSKKILSVPHSPRIELESYLSERKARLSYDLIYAKNVQLQSLIQKDYVMQKELENYCNPNTKGFRDAESRQCLPKCRKEMKHKVN